MNTAYTEFSKIAVDAAARLSQLSLQSTERMVALQLGFAKESLAQATKSAQSAAGAKDVQEFLSQRAKSAEATMERLVGYSRDMYEVASDAQSGLVALAEERMAGFQKAVTESMDQAAKAAPAGSEAAVAAMKQSLAATTAAFDTFTRAARQAASYADASVKSKPRSARK